MIPKTVNVRERMTLRYCQTEKFKSETLSLNIALPLVRERYLTTLLFSVLCRGCEKYPTQAQINRLLDHLWGAAFSARDFTVGETQVVGFSSDFVGASYLPKGGEEILSEMLTLMREVLFCPVLENGLLSSHYVESEKRILCDSIRAKKNSPRAYAFERCAELMHGDDPIGLSSLGTVEEVESVTPEILTAHWKYILENVCISFFYLGARDEGDVVSALERVFGETLAGRGAERACTVYAEPLPARECNRHEESLPVTQGQLIMGFRFPTVLSGRRHFIAALLGEVLGASPVSKLFVNVRERLGLCYSCSAFVSRFACTAYARCGLDAENREIAEREILNQISLLACGEISDVEWEAARTSICDSMRQSEDSPSAIDRANMSRMLVGLPLGIDELTEVFLSVTREEVAAMAGEMVLDTVFFLNPTRAGEEDEDEEN